MGNLRVLRPGSNFFNRQRLQAKMPIAHRVDPFESLYYLAVIESTVDGLTFWFLLLVLIRTFGSSVLNESCCATNSSLAWLPLSTYSLYITFIIDLSQSNSSLSFFSHDVAHLPYLVAVVVHRSPQFV